MSQLAHRKNAVLKQNSADSTRPDFASSYTVTAYEVGAMVNGGSSGTTITVRAGHGFAALDKLMVNTDTDKFRVVSGVTSTTVIVTSDVTVVNNDKLVNLGPDTGTTTPNYDGSGATIYSDSASGSAVSQSRVTCDSLGEYEFWTEHQEIWELIRNGSGTPVEINADVQLSHPAGLKQGFYGVTPVVRPAAYTQTYSTATRTHSSPTATALTDSSGGTASQTLAAITGGGAGCEDATKNAVASLADEVNKLITDLANVKQVLNQVVDDLQSNGLMQ